MSNYKLKDIKWMSQDSILLTLEPKSDKDKLDFYPGQYLTIGFRKFGRPSPVRCFSIVSSPNSNNLQLGIRVYGIFTKSLAHLKPGTNMFVQGPFGNFVIDEEQDKNIIMLFLIMFCLSKDTRKERSSRYFFAKKYLFMLFPCLAA